MKPILLAGILSLAITTAASAATYSAKAEGCTGAGYDRAVLQTDGQYKGMYRCLCNSIARGTSLDSQYELFLTNTYRLNLAITSQDKPPLRVTPGTPDRLSPVINTAPQH